MKNVLYLTLVVFSACTLQAFSAEAAKTEAPGKDLIDFSSIKDLIKKDGLKVSYKKRKQRSVFY